jgi:ABC-2 type transport system permease protein
VSSLKDDVYIYSLCHGSEDEMITSLLEKYTELSDKIHVIVKDPLYTPIYQSIHQRGCNQQQLIFVCKDRSKYVPYKDILVDDYSNYLKTAPYRRVSTGRVVTSAIDYVTSDNLPKAYVLSGNGERALGDSFSSQIKKQNIIVEDLNLLSMDKVPDDASCL